jgi:hypothetical protein
VKLDANRVCRPHDVEWCVVCTCDDVYEHIAVQQDRRRQVKIERRMTRDEERIGEYT